MAYETKWTIPFYSLNNTSCRIDIMKEGYTGLATVLATTNAQAPGVAATDPFTYDEDTSHDLLNFIRVKTGYIRLVELSNNSLEALYPTYATEHYVRVYYGSELVFTGYMQCTEYSSPWVAPPNVREFPVISPLGLMESMLFSAPSTPGTTRVGSLLKEVLTTLSGDYATVIWPSVPITNPSFTVWSAFPWDGKISTLALCPFNPDFSHSDNVSALYSPKSFYEFMHGICATFGYIVHDTPTEIVFAKFNNVGNYCSLPVSTLDSASTSTQLYDDSSNDLRRIENYYNVCNTDGNMNVRRPLKGVKVTAGGVDDVYNDGSIKYSTAFASYDERPSGTSKHVYCYYYTPVGPIVGGDHLLSHATFNAVGLYPLKYGAYDPARDKAIEYKSSWIYKHDASWGEGTCIIRVKFYGIPRHYINNTLLKIAMKRGPNLAEMLQSGYEPLTLGVIISHNTPATASPNPPTITFDGTGGFTPTADLTQYPYSDADGKMFNTFSSGYSGSPLADNYTEVSLWIDEETVLNDGEYLDFDISLVSPMGGSHEKKEYSSSWSAIGDSDETVTAEIHNFWQSLGTSSFGNVNTVIDGEPETFAYMQFPQYFLEVPLKQWATLTQNLYLPRYTFWKNNSWHWRVIGVRFNPWNDEYKITLAHTQTI